jgi:hypothetical protein
MANITLARFKELRNLTQKTFPSFRFSNIVIIG